MKKAKEYYQELKPIFESTEESEIKKASSVVFKSIVKEIDEVRVMRNCKSESGLRAIIREQNDKWNSVCRKAEKDGMKFLNENAVNNYFKEELNL